MAPRMAHLKIHVHKGWHQGWLILKYTFVTDGTKDGSS